MPCTERLPMKLMLRLKVSDRLPALALKVPLEH
jgi:hypothetical protein